MDESKNSESVKERLERIAEKSLGYSLLFSKLISSTPTTFYTPSRMREKNKSYIASSSQETGSNFFDDYMGDSLKLTMEEYGLTEPIEGFKAVIAEISFENGRTPNYLAYWESFKSMVEGIKKFAQFFIPASTNEKGILPVQYLDEFSKESKELDRTIGDINYELSKITGNRKRIKKAMENLLIDMYKEDADVIKIFLGTLDT